MPELEDPPDGEGHVDDTDVEMLNLQPITLDDIRVNTDYRQLDESESVEWKKRNHFAALCFGKRKPVKKLQSDHNLWNRALSKASSAGDEWESFDVEGIPAERAVRYRYNAMGGRWITDDVTIKMEPQSFNAGAMGGRWITDDVTIKMEPQSFNAGAMRRCFRAKKPTNFTTKDVWHRGNTNYVAKEYMDTVQRQTYFDDVRLQMEAKLWGNEYNRLNPPKKVDIVQMCAVELTDRPGRPLFHLEHYIGGDYVKYNSNSGFVRDENLRLTPQTFSHFTFERSGHELMVVDIQGVDDLYTDPQIHTADGECYGDGNLGTRGMALFFHSHVCNDICRCLGLTAFDLASSETSELSQLAQKQKLCKTVSRGSESNCSSPREYSVELKQLLRRRNPSSECFNSDDLSSSIEPDSPLALSSDGSDSVRSSELPTNRGRFISECSNGSNDATDRAKLQDPIGAKHRPSDVTAEKERVGSTGLPSILGQIHFDMAKYHEVGRFVPAGSQCDHVTGGSQYDRAAALFHLERAVDCGVVPAMVTAADLYLCRPHDLLSDVQLDATPDNRSRGVALLSRAATAGDRTSMVDLARCYDLGTYLSCGEEDRDWDRAVHWYERAVQCECEEAADDEPDFLLLGRAAGMLKSGGPHLEPDYSRAADMFNDAAEKASAMMKGRAANKYFMEAEQCWAMCED